MHFIKTGVFDKKYGLLLSELFDWRQKGDYENIFDYDQESVQPLFIPVKEMLDLIKEEIQKSIDNWSYIDHFQADFCQCSQKPSKNP